MMERFQFACPCNFGLEGVLSGELKRLGMEEVSWFLEHFGEAFGLTLDRLQRGEGQSGSPE